MSKIVWYIKQLIPLKYHSVYTVDNNKYISVWYQWFGKVFNCKKYLLK